MQNHGRGFAEDLPKAPGVKIIRAQEESAWRDGYRFLDEARKAYEAERTRGYAEGMAAASREASKLVVDTTAKVDRYIASLEKQIARLSFDIVRRILSEFDDAELVARAARNALADFREAKAIRIRVHPSAEAEMRRMLAQHGLDRTGEPVAFTLETDDELGARACILSTDFVIIEATVDSQLAAIAQAMGLDLAKATE
jgi:type III secretion protein L